MSLLFRSSRSATHYLRFAQTQSLRTSQLAFARTFHSTTAKMAAVRKLEKKSEYHELVEDTTPKAGVTAAANHKSLIIIDAFAVWCGPCKVIAPVFEELAAKYGDKAHFVQIDVDDLPDIAQELGVNAMPTFTVIKDGKPFDKLVGASKQKLEELVVKAVTTVA